MFEFKAIENLKPNKDLTDILKNFEYTVKLGQIKTLNYNLVKVRYFMIMNRIYNGEKLLEKVLTEIRALQDVLDKEQY
mgnify:CR=1 FL=1